jgi:Retrotransposon gag protein
LVSHLSGIAAEWAHATLASKLGLWENFKLFNAQFENLYSNKHARKEAVNRLTVIKQNQRNLQEYIAEFTAISLKSGYNQQVLFDLFERGLDPELRQATALHR